MISAKICGITSVKEAKGAIESGASAIGLIFYKYSPRRVSVEIANEIIGFVDGKVPIIGVFVDEKVETVNAILSKVNLDILQLHGSESPQYCKQLNLPIIKVFRVDSTFNSSWLEGYNVSAFLFDTYKKGLPGGTGNHFNWKLISNLKIETAIILSGGLTPENIIDGINEVNPIAVDVSSGVENCPGEKNPEKLNKLFKKIGIVNKDENIFHKIKCRTLNV
jgi:phosphoribosylanthranilate isomerase